MLKIVPLPAKNRRAAHAAAAATPIDQAQRNRLRDAFLRLATLAERGEVDGIAYSAIDASGALNQGVLGRFENNRMLAHYGVSRLADYLLWPDDMQDAL